jgi:hypothetical protein
MKLTSTQIKRTVSQCEAQPIPDNHPLIPQLNSLFGDHTFFLDTTGLTVVEPINPNQTGVQAGKMVNLANWSDASGTGLLPHEPEPTDVIVELESKH